MANTYVKIASVTVGAGGAATIDFTNIPATYDDLVIKTSLRTTNTTLNSFQNLLLKFNASTTTFTGRLLYGDGTSATSITRTDSLTGLLNNNNTTSSTANTFTSADIYIPNYAGSTNKSWSAEAVTETNGTGVYTTMTAGLWSTTTAISSIELYPSANDFIQYSTAVLYGIKKS